MITTDNVIVVDVDGTLCPIKPADESYEDLLPEPRLVERLRELASQGWRIIIYSSRNMRSYNGDIGTINAKTLPDLLGWLDRHQVPYHEIYIGKPWQGTTASTSTTGRSAPAEIPDRSGRI